MLTLERSPVWRRDESHGEWDAGPAGPGAGGSGSWGSGSRGGTDAVATLAIAALTMASVFGLSRVFTTSRWAGPVLVTALGVHAIAWATRRLHWPEVPALLASAVGCALIASWTVLGAFTTYGVPTGRTISEAGTALQHAQHGVSTVVVPVQPTTGFVLACALIAGVAAALADWLAFRRGSSLLGAAPAFAMFVSCCALGYGPGRQWVISAEGLALLLFALVHRASIGLGRQWLAGVQSGSVAWALPAGAIVGSAAILTVLLAAPSVKGNDGGGALGWRAGGIGAGGPREVANPIVDLHTRLVNFSDVGVFTVQSPVESYWRLTSLDTFTGQAWVSTNSYKGFSGRLPGVDAEPPGTRTVSQTFHIQALESVWLPAAFTPLSVKGVRDVDYDPNSSSLITSHRTSDGLSYEVTSYQYLSTLEPARLRAAPPLKVDSTMDRYLQLPSSVPSSVYALARALTANQHSEYDKAIALQDYFLGPSFTYSLQPPTDGFGIDALTSFLFQTRTGYCQQFAGSYAVLARAAGLPTRLAVGFTPGTDVGGSFQVLDADAHTWPEVYFGPRYGWLPFEPTKSFSDPNAVTYAAAKAGPGSSTKGPNDVSPLAPKGSPTTLPQPALPASPASTAARSGHDVVVTPSPGASGLTVAIVILLLIVGWATLNIGVRRARWGMRRRRYRDEPASVVLSYWQDTSEVLAWWGINRLPGDTETEFANRAAGSLQSALGEPSPWVSSGVRRLAAMASEALFAPSLHERAAVEAEMVATELRQRLYRKAPARRLLLWWFTPAPGRA